MATTHDPGRPPPVSPELRRTISADRIGCFVDEEVLGSNDVGTLKAILAGKLTPDFPVSRKRAIGALARSDPSPQTAEMLGHILADREAPKADRAAASAWLGRMPAGSAEDALLAVLPASSGSLRVEITEALARAGSRKALAELEQLDPEKEEHAGRSLALALVLARVRVAPETVTPDKLERALGVRWSDERATPVDSTVLRRVAAELEPQPFGINPSLETGFRFACAGSDHLMLLNAELRRGEIARRLATRSLIAGLVVSRPERAEHYVVRWLLLTSPGEHSIRMMLTRTNGEASFVGEAMRDEKGLLFVLRDTGVERVPAEIQGRITDGEIGWTIQSWQGPLRAKRRPLPLPLALSTGGR